MFKNWNWDWDDAWATLWLISASVAIVLFFFGMVQPHDVDYYYIHGECSYGHWTWHPDEPTICTNDQQHLLDFVKQANEVARKPK